MKKTSQLEIREIKSIDENIIFDFFIDGVELSKLLNINRLTFMQFSDFDLDIVQVDPVVFPNYNRIEVVKSVVDSFLGKIKPTNQFLTERAVIYRCMCGCDYCGVISLVIDFEKDFVYWRDIRYELDELTETEGVNSIDEIKFDKTQYYQEFNRYLEKYCK